MKPAPPVTSTFATGCHRSASVRGVRSGSPPDATYHSSLVAITVRNNGRLEAAGWRLQAGGCRLEAAGCRLRGTAQTVRVPTNEVSVVRNAWRTFDTPLEQRRAEAGGCSLQPPASSLQPAGGIGDAQLFLMGRHGYTERSRVPPENVPEGLPIEVVPRAGPWRACDRGQTGVDK